jgi:hypothetical protein
MEWYRPPVYVRPVSSLRPLLYGLRKTSVLTGILVVIKRFAAL